MFQDEGLAKKVHSSYKINLKADDGAVKSWIIDTKSKPAYVGHDERPYEVEVNVKDIDFVKIVTGKMLPDLAYRLGKIKIKGVMGKATRLKSLFKGVEPEVETVIICENLFFQSALSVAF
ncbi:SCP-2 sterol transfer family protein [Cooperia oncophora]